MRLRKSATKRCLTANNLYIGQKGWRKLLANFKLHSGKLSVVNLPAAPVSPSVPLSRRGLVASRLKLLFSSQLVNFAEESSVVFSQLRYRGRVDVNTWLRREHRDFSARQMSLAAQGFLRVHGNQRERSSIRPGGETEPNQASRADWHGFRA
jgi:hypothetical protein